MTVFVCNNTVKGPTSPDGSSGDHPMARMREWLPREGSLWSFVRNSFSFEPVCTTILDRRIEDQVLPRTSSL